MTDYRKGRVDLCTQDILATVLALLFQTGILHKMSKFDLCLLYVILFSLTWSAVTGLVVTLLLLYEETGHPWLPRVKSATESTHSVQV